nr:aldolase/citrate lyase family protein [Halegenticoccus tardaugens]
MADAETIATADKQPAFVVLPDVHGPDELEIVSSVFDAHGADVDILPLIEKPSAVFTAQEIANVNDSVYGLGFAAIDYQREMGISILDENDLSVPQYLISMAAHSADVLPIDKPTLCDVDDTRRLRAEADAAAAMGYSAKFAMTNEQARVINDAFTPSQEVVERAKRFVETFEAQDEGLVTIDGVAVDKPVITQLRDVLVRAERARRDG